MSIKALSEYTFYSRYSQRNKEEKRRETWNEAVERLFDMHRIKYAKEIQTNPELGEYIDFAEDQQKKKRVLASQRSLQFAAEPILKHELKMFNCLFTHIDRERVFQEMMYSLLCGCGVGFSVQHQHIDQLGDFNIPQDGDTVFTIPDSIEGWSDAVGVLMASWSTKMWGEFDEYRGKNIKFDFSKIRPEGELISGRFKAPGPEGLKCSLEKIRSILVDLSKDKKSFKLRPIDAYDIIMHISDAVLSGGVRRSATLCLFSKEDKEMLNAKTGNWFVDNPQRARSNNSVALLRGHVSKEEFAEIMRSTREYGEPGFIWTDDLESGYNPCVEINLYPKTKDGRSGFHACNLTEINGKFCDSEESFMKACKASAIIGTLQAGYTNLKYLKPESKEIFEEEALLGCSITGWMDNPDILFNPTLQRRGAKEILKVNEDVANLIGIKTAARATCVKPAGSTSCVLGTASGIHPHHAVRYIRRTQVNKTEFCGQVFQKYNPLAVEPSVWSSNGTDNVISFLCEVPAGAITKNQVGALDLLEKVKLTQKNWVEYGTREERCINPKLRHNVSNTINVKDDEWGDVEKFIFSNQNYFAGISLLAASGDLDYAQAPFSTVLTPTELVREYGDASVFASGLVVDGLHAFDNDLWAACSVALGINPLPYCGKEPEYPKSRNYRELAKYFEDREKYEKCDLKLDWVRRVDQFADRYFGYDSQRVEELKILLKENKECESSKAEKEFFELNLKLKKCTYCLKHVSLWKTWCDLKREYNDIDWKAEQEEIEEFHNADELGAQACAGGACSFEV